MTHTPRTEHSDRALRWQVLGRAARRRAAAGGSQQTEEGGSRDRALLDTGSDDTITGDIYMDYRRLGDGLMSQTDASSWPLEGR